MDLLNGKIKNIYFKYLSAAFGSAMITSIYSIVDMAMVGQYQGPLGAAALAVISPMWNVIYSLGLLVGVGGAILFSVYKGEEEDRHANIIFTKSLKLAILLSIISWFSIFFFDKEILIFFGADTSVLPHALDYVKPIKVLFPVFLFDAFISAYLRNDKNPALATKATLIAGIINMIGDYVFVFLFDMGVFGAGLATIIGAVINLLIMLTHFKSKKNTIKIIVDKVNQSYIDYKNIIINGFPTFVIDIAMGVVTVLFNRQIIKYLGTDSLSVYGVIANITTLAQCTSYSIGNASQPIISINFGAKNYSRINEVLKYAIYTSIFFGIFWGGSVLIAPNTFINIFMKPTQSVLFIAPDIMRKYAISYLFLPINVFSTYYFQSILKPNISMIVSLMRGVFISGAMILFLPHINKDLIWFSMVIAEVVTFIYVWYKMYIFSTFKGDYSA